MGKNSWNELKEKVKANTDLAQLVSPHSKLVSTARGYKACCPLPGHKEKTPSFNINSGDNYYYCYGCQRSGDVFTFLEEVEGLSFFEALKELAGRLGYELPKDSSFDKKKDSKEKSRFQAGLEMLKKAETFFQRNLLEGKSPEVKAALEYLKKRGITDEEIKELALGWAPSGGRVLLSKLSKEQLRIGEDVRVIANYSGRNYDFFSDRLIIPIRDQRGRPRGFSGRTLKEVSSKNPKYKNSPESDFFKKKEILYGLDRAVKFIREERIVCFVEGFFDQWALLRLGIPSVAVMGTALTKEHLESIKRHTQQVVLFLDSDEAGRKSTLRSLPLLYEEGFDAKVFALDSYKDPDEWLAANSELKPEQILEKIKKAPEALEWWCLQILLDGEKQGKSKLSLLEDLSEPWSMTVNQPQRNVLAEEISRRIGVSADEVKKAIAASKKKKPSPQKQSSPENELPPWFDEQTPNSVNESFAPVRKAITPSEKASVELLALVCAHWDVLGPQKEPDSWLFQWSLTPLAGVWESFLFWCSENSLEPLDRSSLKKWLDSNKALESLWKSALMKGFVLDLGEHSRADISSSFVELLNSVKTYWARERLQLLQGQLKMAGGDDQKSAQILQQIHEMQRMKLDLEKSKKPSTVQ